MSLTQQTRSHETWKETGRKEENAYRSGGGGNEENVEVKEKQLYIYMDLSKK